MENEQLKRIADLLEVIADELYVTRMDREHQLIADAFDQNRNSLVEAIERERQNLNI